MKLLYGGILLVALLSVYVFGHSALATVEYRSPLFGLERFFPLPQLDKEEYDARMLALARVSTTTLALAQASSTQLLWPVQAPYPNARAILPFKRVVAYYGNFYSRAMGVLGEYPEEEVLAKLASTTTEWSEADPSTPAIPAIHYIATVAQAGAGKEGKYILRMPDDQIDHALAMAAKIQGIVFLDVQVAQSTLQNELPHLEKYLKMSQVHLGIDPEFSMKRGERPGTVIGTFDAVDINYAAEYLARIVQEHRLPPKILVVHRFTNAMVTNYKDIKPLPEVQIVMDMDGFGSKDLKKATWSRVIVPEPVQFAGIKLFYKNDARSEGGMFTPREVLDELTPAPVYVQYQ
jgi:hypothetical protein